MTEADFHLGVGTNLKGTFFTLQKLVPLMPAGGSIMLNGSIQSAAPGFIDTDLIRKVGLSEETVAQIGAQAHARIPLARSGSADEVAKAVLFLASDDAAYVTGVELAVDGGWTQI